MSSPQFVDTYYEGTTFLPLYQIELFTKKELNQCFYSGANTAVNNVARWKKSSIWCEAENVAWLFRQLFYPRRFIPLRPLVIQAFRLFKRGYQSTELMCAMREAATRGVRQVPRTLLFFLGWIASLRARMRRVSAWREAEERECQWQFEKLSYRMSARDGPPGDVGEPEKIAWVLQRAFAGLPRTLQPING